MFKSELGYVRFQNLVARCCLAGERATGFHIRDAMGRLPFVGVYQVDEKRDTLLALFPRSGNTCIRAIIACAMRGRPLRTLSEIDYYVPDGHAKTPRCLINEIAIRVGCKTHRAAQREPRGFHW